MSVVSGSIRGETLSLPLQIELLEQDYNTVGSFTAAALLTLMAILTLFLKSMLQWRLANQKERAQQEGIMSIEIANIKKSFGRTRVLNDISLDIPSGQMVALLGPSAPENHPAANYRRSGASDQRSYPLPRYRRQSDARSRP